MKGQMETVVAIQAMTVSNNDRRTDHRDYRRTRSLSPYRDNYNHVVENVLPVHTVGAKGLLKKESTGETMTEKDHRIHAKAVVSTINVILAHSEMQYVMLVGNVAIYKVYVCQEARSRKWRPPRPVFLPGQIRFREIQSHALQRSVS